MNFTKYDCLYYNEWLKIGQYLSTWKEISTKTYENESFTSRLMFDIIVGTFP